MILGVRIYRRNVCILYRSLECIYKGMVIHEYMIPCPQYCAPVLSSVINMEGAELFCACHGRGDIAGCIGGLGSIRFTCPFTFRCDFHRRCFSPKKRHGMIWDNKLQSSFQMIQKSEVGKKLQHALRQWLLKRNLLHYLWLNIPGSEGRRKRE